MRLLALFLFLAAPAWALPDTPKPSKAVLLLGAADGAVAFYDVHRTVVCYPRDCYEANPLARPVMGHPRVVYSLAAGEMAGLGYLAERMRHNRFHRVWWVPQVAAIGLHLWAAKTSAK